MKIIYNLLKIGTHSEQTENQTRQTKLINASTLVACGFLLFYTVLNFLMQKYLLSLIDFIAVLIMFVTFIFQKNRKHYWAGYWFLIVLIILEIIISIKLAKGRGIEYAILIPNILGILFFDKRMNNLFIFIICVFSFIFIKYFHYLSYDHLFYLNQDFYYSNINFLAISITFFVLVNKLKMDYLKSEKKLIENNKILLEQKKEIQQINEELNTTINAVEEEKQKSDKLLLNILPQEVASELKETGKTEVKYFESVTVLFADVKGFSALATKISPQELISQLDETFTKMDEISLRFGLERIKTIGDCYMACGGLPEANKTHPFDAILSALHIQKWIDEERKKRNGNFWQIRLGLHTGDAVAGVIGKTKFAYDIWGNTVNLASRMESGGEVGKVNVTEQTFEMVKDYFEGFYREEIEAKNIGKVKAYFITRLKPEYSKDEEGFEPNEKFGEVYKSL